LTRIKQRGVAHWDSAPPTTLSSTGDPVSILGTVVRTRTADLDTVVARIATLVGADLALNPGDGRLVVVLEDAQGADGATVAAATNLAAIAQWPEVLNTSLVYEYSGPDAPPPAGTDGLDFRAWRRSLADPLLNSFRAPPPCKPTVVIS
jgi:nitrate reductase NapAB chaperone NapD